MRLLVLGDVHLEHVTLSRALDAFAPSCDQVFAVGDIMDGIGGARAAHETIRVLRARGVECIAGNHDRWLLMGASRGASEAIPRECLTGDEIEWLATLPRFRTLDTPAGRAIVAHGFCADDFHWIEADSPPYAATGHPEWNRLRAGGFALHIGGHTHRPYVRWIADPDPDGDPAPPYDGATFVNAGTLHRDHRPCVCALDTSRRTATWHPFDGERFTAPRVVGW